MMSAFSNRVLFCDTIGMPVFYKGEQMYLFYTTDKETT